MASQGSSINSYGHPADLQAIIAKTDPSGNIAGCATFPTCLQVSDTTLEMGTFHIEPHPVLDLEDVVLEVEPATFTFTEYCDYPPPPVPDFYFPDTLCLGESATTANTYNHLAQAREWHLTGPGVDSTLRDSFSFGHTFGQPGQYTLRQSVWVLGCRSDHERGITVLPPLAVSIAADSLICPDEPQHISASANRAASFEWAGPGGAGGTGPVLPVGGSGAYTVTATDGHCEATGTATVEVAAEALGGQEAIALPKDTTVCERDLPYLLVPKSTLADSFVLDGGLVPAVSFLLPGAGTYAVGMEALGCRFQREFRLEVDCHADVYLPTSFSPNGDGINDEFGPLGTDFDVLELAVFDRWGGLVFRGKDAWHGGRAGQGVYAYRLRYRDLLTLREEEVQGEVTLTK